MKICLYTVKAGVPNYIIVYN